MAFYIHALTWRVLWDTVWWVRVRIRTGCETVEVEAMSLFQLVTDYKPSGDQEQAIAKLLKSLRAGNRHQCLLGVTGSGKTFTMANLIAAQDRPVLVLSHNKTLAAQLYSELKAFFPHNAVEYFVSYFDYYQPEAYIASTDTYIEKDSAINEEIDRLCLNAMRSLLLRRDVIVVASVSCIYGLGAPEDYRNLTLSLHVGQEMDRDAMLACLAELLFERNDYDFQRGRFRVRGDVVEVYPAQSDGEAIRVEFFGDEIDAISLIDAGTGRVRERLQSYLFFPVKQYVSAPEKRLPAIQSIRRELAERVEWFEKQNKLIEAQRLKMRTDYDLELINEIGFCKGIENYSRYFDGREAGTRPYCLLDFFPKDYLMVIDESHVSVPQIHAMYGGDRARKVNLVEYGFRLPAAMDNRPLKFEEFQEMTNQVIYVSATPADYELAQSEGVVVEQLIRPTGLLDPIIDVRPSLNQIDDLMEEILVRAERDERTLVVTLTKRMAEELAEYLLGHQVRCTYIHSDVDTMERVEIMNALRRGEYDVLIGVNLLREGLDLPEVSLVAILDADKEGFLRNHRSLTQTAGRAARNVNGRVIMYADKITESMERTITETNRRREKQLAYNEAHGITPKQIQKEIKSGLTPTLSQGEGATESTANKPETNSQPSTLNSQLGIAADPIVAYMSRSQLEKSIARTRKLMQEAAGQLRFAEAAQYRDEMFRLEEILKGKSD